MWFAALLIVIILIYAGSSAIVYFTARNSPMGYEDPRTGFHVGEPPKGQRPL